ncbi:ATP-binding protein [Pontibacter rufus]|uniref:ATP-binding protein n=1 Tax=Pontibacter rufus TaxID=2791028 RepID=UPI00351C8A8F
MKVEAERVSATETALPICVRDTGLSIPPELVSRIFGRYFQVDSSLKRGCEGAGIRLALTKELWNCMVVRLG